MRGFVRGLGGLLGWVCLSIVGCSAPTVPESDVGLGADAGDAGRAPDALALDGSPADAAVDGATADSGGGVDGAIDPDAPSDDDGAVDPDGGVDADGAVDPDGGGTADGGASDPDGGAAADGGADPDGGSAPDAGASDSGVDACGCTGDADCDDGSPCNGAERCVACACTDGAPPLVGAACSDGDPCTLDDACDGVSACVATDRGLDACGAACVDLDADPAHCGSCANACAAGELCVGGACAGWAPSGGPVDGAPLPTASAHALASDGTDPYVAWIGSDGSARVSRPMGAGWTTVGAPIAPAGGAGPYVDLAFAGATPLVLWGETTGSRNLRVTELAAGLWSDGGRTGYDGPCVAPFALALALDGSTPHLATVGAGGCGIGVAYAYATGPTWWQTPMPPAVMLPGLITMMGSFGIDVAFDGSRALLLLSEAGSRSVRTWSATPAPGAWSRLGSALDVSGPAPGGAPGTFLFSIAVDSSGDPWVALADDDATGRRGVYVKRWDDALSDWTMVGPGPISDPRYDGDQPSIAFVGGEPYVAWVSVVAGVSQVFVARWNGFAWTTLGPALNADATTSAAMPSLADVGGTPTVAFREPGGGAVSGRIYVRSLR